MLELPEAWVWDFWLADDGTAYHVFFLKASRTLIDPDRRHWHASVGHAVSTDLTHWTVVADALVPDDPPAFDDLAIWTGSVVRDDADQWRMFYTGLSRADDGLVQRLGCAVSDDLEVWKRRRVVGLCEADGRFYERRATSTWRPEDHWRDPFVVRDDDGLWHAYVTARARGDGRGLGVVGHAVSSDLDRWDVQQPLSEPTGRFEWLEVISVQQVEGRWVLLFSCLSAEMSGAPAGAGGIWSVPVAGLGSPIDVSSAVRLTSEDLYVGRVVLDRAGTWQFLAFRNRDENSAFEGGLTDPVPVRWNATGTGLELVGGLERWRPESTSPTPPASPTYTA